MCCHSTHIKAQATYAATPEVQLLLLLLICAHTHFL